jgi:DNA-binding transcriptional LysR family regulator
MDKFQEMRTFCAVVDAGSFVKAADLLGVSKAAVSRTVSDLERRLNVRLMQRTTRRLSLTDEGRQFYAQTTGVLAAIEDAEAQLLSRSGVATGVLRINAPVSFGVLHLAPLWSRYLQAHPQVTLDISLSDRVVDMVEEGYDLAIRIARLPSSTLISRRLASTRIALAATPDYLRRAGTPSHPSELAEHAILAYSQWADGHGWTFHHRQTGLAAQVNIRPILQSNNGDTCVAAALQGLGVVLQPDFLLQPHLRQGRLVELMPDWQSIDLGIYALYPSRHFAPPKLRAMVQFLADELKDKPWDRV